MFFSIYYLLQHRREDAFLNVYLPCLFLLPSYYACRIPHLPPIAVSAWALLPLGVSLLIDPPARTKFKRADLWMILFLVSFAASEMFRENSPKDGVVFFAAVAIQMAFPYIVGRRLIEPALRLATLKRIVLLFLCLTPAIFLEAGVSLNPWLRIGERVFGISAWSVQSRGGRARVAACFGHAILAGILFLIVFLFNCALAQIYKRDKTRLGPTLSTLERYRVPAILLLLFLFLTQSRGPMACTAIGLLIVQIPKFKNIKVAGIAIALLLTIGGIEVSDYLDKYTDVPVNGTMTEQQQSAYYRKLLLENYKPIVEAGGWLGWGALSVPVVGGQSSMDNEYMLMQLSQGKLGLYLFLLLITESLLSAVRCAFTFQSAEGRFFAFSILASLIGLFVSLSSVFLGEQVVQVCFLLIGWSQSLQDAGDDVLPASAYTPKYRFRRVFA
jgi:hypothetical protein